MPQRNISATTQEQLTAKHSGCRNPALLTPVEQDLLPPVRGRNCSLDSGLTLHCLFMNSQIGLACGQILPGAFAALAFKYLDRAALTWVERRN